MPRGDTPLHRLWAGKCPTTAKAEVLLRAGADRTRRNRRGETALELLLRLSQLRQETALVLSRFAFARSPRVVADADDRRGADADLQLLTRLMEKGGLPPLAPLAPPRP